MKKHVGLAAILAGVLMIGVTALPVLSAEPDLTEGSNFVQLYTGQSYNHEWDDETNTELASSRSPKITMTEGRKAKYPELAEAFKELNEKTKTRADETFQQLLSDAKERRGEDPEYQTPFSDTEEYYVTRQDENIVSILGMYSGYTGGAHGYYGYRTVNFDTKTGDALKLTDLVLDGDAFKALVKEAVTSSYPETEEDLVNRYFDETAPDDLLWTAGYEGITCYFDPYTLGPYAIGSQTVLIPYAGNEQLFSDPVKDVPENFGVDIPLYERVKIGGHELSVYGSGEYEDVYDSVHILIDGEESAFSDNIYAYGIRAMYLKADGGEYLYLQYLEDNDYRSIDVYQLGSKAEHVGITDLGMAGLYDEEQEFSATATLPDPECMLFSTRTDLLGTSSVRRTYRVGSDGMPEAAVPLYQYADSRVLTTKTEITAEEVDEEGNDLGQMQIPAGTALTTLRTDNDSFVDLGLDDGRIARVEVSAASYPHTIGGTDIEELFDGIIFAG